MVSQRQAWKLYPFKCKPYKCPTCGRDKGMLYLFPDGSLRYVCFCGSNISTHWIAKRYNFDEEKFDEFEQDNWKKRLEEIKEESDLDLHIRSGN